MTNTQAMGVKENLAELKTSLPADVTLVAVSKTKPNALIAEAYDTGHRDFGENYVQELVEKQAALSKDIRWHFIGHLQSNKVKYIVPFVHLIHGIDSLKLLREVNKQAEKYGRVVNCLLQVYIAKEESKFGFDPDEIKELFASGIAQQLAHVKINGLMGMASNTDDGTLIKMEFDGLAALFHELQALSVPGTAIQYLSCGMSSDYLPALAAGSNMLRIGSSIFGERQYT